MDDIGRMESLERTEGLVNKVLSVVVGKVLGTDHSVHIGFHEFLDNYRLRGRDRQGSAFVNCVGGVRFGLRL